MQFLVLTQRRSALFSSDEFAALYDAEVAQAKVLHARSFTRQIWHRADGQGACQVVEADDEDEVRRMLDSLPFAAAGMLDITIVALKPYAGFSR